MFGSFDEKTIKMCKSSFNKETTLYTVKRHTILYGFYQACVDREKAHSPCPDSCVRVLYYLMLIFVFWLIYFVIILLMNGKISYETF